ncbi:LCP family protein [Pseudarthrobacter sp. J75]|uniref:LCP family protein n=1 Tax=unclassified Pseudarthrobacter TaxID=2647000 RepID=UPI002E80FB4F|nr:MULTISPECIES: LCP family protein [unclassified Pseudarthrobacter]MEE2523329.1 LCP family protein [Pseudarthrobacter sp. J47]MEE2529294.1 LCP family protein [Pseudarthrobacter sp. J75]
MGTDDADSSTPTGQFSKHTETTAVGAARHLGTGRRMAGWLKAVTWIASLALLSAVIFAGYWFIRLQSNLSTAPLNAGSTPTGTINQATDRMQILILGSDTRDGANAEYGTSDDSTGYGQSDVMMLMDISADNSRVSVISFPRDLLVTIPECTDQKTGEVYPERSGAMINEAMAQAGIGCAVDTVNKLTGLEVDHFMMADFNAVTELSNAVGGVEVCVSDPVYDPDSRLRLPAGNSSVQGEMALAWLRSRHAFEDGGDLGRIKAQQAFLSSLTRKVTGDGTLSDPVKMLRIADVVTRNLTLDEGFASPSALVTVGSRLKNIDVGKVAFVAAPTTQSVIDPNRLDLAQPAASQLFAALRDDVDLTDPTGTESPTPAPTEVPTTPAATETTPAEPVAPIYDKALQPVSVANGSGVSTRYQEIATALISDGFTQLGEAAAVPAEQTVIYYSAEFADVAADVAALFGIPDTQLIASTSVYGVQLNLGADFATGTQYGAATLPPDVVNQTAGDVVCQQVNPFLIDRG